MIKRIWVYATLPSKSGQKRWLERMQWLRITDVALFVNGQHEKQFNLSSRKRTKLLDTANRLHEIDVTPHFVTWLRPSERYMKEAARKLRPLCEEANVRSLQFDVEEPWAKNVGSASNAKAVIERHWQFDDWPTELGTTGIVFAPKSVFPVAEKCDYSLPQAYSTRKNSQTVYVGNDGKERRYMRPNALPAKAHSKWRDLWDTVYGIPYWRKSMVMGLAAWNLNRPGGISQKAAMQRAIVASENLSSPRVEEVAYWSFKWIVQSTERAAFIRAASTKARAGIPQAGSATPEFESYMPMRQADLSTVY